MKRTKDLIEARADFVKREFDTRPKGESLDVFAIRISIPLFISPRTIYRDLEKKGIKRKEIELLKQRATMLQSEANKRNGETLEKFIIRKSKELFVSVSTVDCDLKRKDVCLIKS